MYSGSAVRCCCARAPESRHAVFLICNTDKDPLASYRRIVYLFSGGQHDRGLFADPSEDETLLKLQHANLWNSERKRFSACQALRHAGALLSEL